MGGTSLSEGANWISDTTWPGLEWQLPLSPGDDSLAFQVLGGTDWNLPTLPLPVISPVDFLLSTTSSAGSSTVPASQWLTLKNIGAVGVSGAEDGESSFKVTAQVQQGELSGPAHFQVTNNNGVTTVAEEAGSFEYRCPDGVSCPVAPYGHAAYMVGKIELESELPGDNGTLTLSGTSSLDTANGVLTTAGVLTVFGQTLNAPAIESEADATSLFASVDLSPVVGFPFTQVELPLELDHDALTLCGEGEADADVDGLSGTLTADVEVCTGATESLDFSASGTLIQLAGENLYSPALYGDITGLTLAGLAYFPGVFSGYLVGPYAGPESFNLTATTTLTHYGFKLYNAEIAFAPAGLSASGTLYAGIAGSFALSGPFVDKKPVLSGSGLLDIDGLAFTASLQSESALEITGEIAVPPLSCTVNGTVAPPGNVHAEGVSEMTYVTTEGGWYFPTVDVEALSCIKATGACAGVATPVRVGNSNDRCLRSGSERDVARTVGGEPLGICFRLR